MNRVKKEKRKLTIITKKCSIITQSWKYKPWYSLCLTLNGKNTAYTKHIIKEIQSSEEKENMFNSPKEKDKSYIKQIGEVMSSFMIWHFWKLKLTKCRYFNYKLVGWDWSLSLTSIMCTFVRVCNIWPISLQYC